MSQFSFLPEMKERLEIVSHPSYLRKNLAVCICWILNYEIVKQIVFFVWEIMWFPRLHPTFLWYIQHLPSTQLGDAARETEKLGRSFVHFLFLLILSINIYLTSTQRNSQKLKISIFHSICFITINNKPAWFAEDYVKEKRHSVPTSTPRTISQSTLRQRILRIT